MFMKVIFGPEGPHFEIPKQGLEDCNKKKGAFLNTRSTTRRYKVEENYYVC